MVEVYIRIGDKFNEKVDVILFNLHPDYCLYELDTMARALQAVYICITVLPDAGKKYASYQWKYYKD